MRGSRQWFRDGAPQNQKYARVSRRHLLCRMWVCWLREAFRSAAAAEEQSSGEEKWQKGCNGVLYVFSSYFRWINIFLKSRSDSAFWIDMSSGNQAFCTKCICFLLILVKLIGLFAALSDGWWAAGEGRGFFSKQVVLFTKAPRVELRSWSKNRWVYGKKNLHICHFADFTNRSVHSWWILAKQSNFGNS